MCVGERLRQVATMAQFVRRTVCGCRTWFERSYEIFERQSQRYVSTACASNNLKVAIIGVGSKTGRSLALCLKQSVLIDELAVWDAHPVYGLMQELTHLDTSCRTFCADASGDRGLEHALRGAKVVALVFDGNGLQEDATLLENIVPYLIDYCHKALVAVVSRSVNSLLPMLFELYKRAGLFECNRLFGVLNLYSTRANRLAADVLAVDPEFVTVPVIGGGTLTTCIPIFSKTRPCGDFTPEELNRLTRAMKIVDAQVSEAYGTLSAESSSLCTGFAAARFCISLCKGLRAETGVQECAYVRSCLIPELKYLGAPLELGPCGIQKHLGVPPLTNQECNALYEALPEIKRAIALGEGLALGRKSSTEICPVPAQCSALQQYQPDVTT